MKIPLRSTGPNLALYIYEKNPQEYAYEVFMALVVPSRSYPMKCMGPIEFKRDPDSLFRDISKEIEKTESRADIVDDKIEAKGKWLYERLFPDELKTIYWEHRDEINSVRIISQEPWIPWEIIKPWRKKENGRIEEDLFLCQRCSLSRWLEEPLGTRNNILKKVKVMVPPKTDLSNALAERDWIKKYGDQCGFETSFISTYTDVKQTLKNADFDILHVSTHGKYNSDNADSSSIELEGKELLTPSDITGVTISSSEDSPVVFLNACQSGAQGFSLTGIGSWATSFIRAGAGTFIGPLWSISDETALRFTQEIYKQLYIGWTELGEAIKNARINCKQVGDPSWLAYQFFGDPNLKVKLGSL